MTRNFSILRGLRSRSSGLGAAIAVTVLAASCGSSASTSGSSSFGSGGGSTFLAGDSDVFHVVGPEGGPFPEGRREYWIENTNKHKVLRWSVAATIPWLDFSEKGGLLAPGAQTTVLAEIDHAVADSLTPGDYPADIVFRDARTGGGEIYLSFLLTVTEEGSSGSILVVTPDEAFETSGDVGGPLDPPSKIYTLENDGDEPIDWSASSTRDWITFASVTSGTLEPAETFDVELTIDADGLGAGKHTGSVEFENVTYGLGTTSREVVVDLAGDGGGRVTDGLQALYKFEESTGDTIHDSSGVTPPLDLFLEDTSKASWLPGALRFDSPTRALSAGAASRFETAVKATEELTIEAWIDPANLTQDGPARIVTISDGSYLRNVTLGQGLWGGQPSDTFNVRLRSTATDLDGMPMLTTASGAAESSLHHVVFTRSSDGTTRIYVNAAVAAEGQTGGSLGNWDPSYRIALGNEIGSSRPWLGTMHLVALYDRALSSSEVEQNLLAGPEDDAAGFLTVTPSSDWSVQGTEGSDFSNKSKAYTLANPGSEAIDYSISFDQPWVDVLGDLSGTILPGQDHEVTFVLLNELVSTFQPNVYTATVKFENLSNGFGDMEVDVVLIVTSSGGGGGGGYEDGRPWKNNTPPYITDSDPTGQEWLSKLTPSGGVTVKQNGAVVEFLDVSGGIKIQANNVTIKNCRITGGLYGVFVEKGTTGAVIEDCEIREAASSGIYGPWGNWSAYRCNIHDSGTDGVKMSSTTHLERCWIHHLGKNDGAHADCNQVRGGSNIWLVENHLDLPVPESENGPGPPYKSNAASINGTDMNDIQDMHMIGNWMNGGNYTVYFSSTGGNQVKGCSLKDNFFGRDYRFGPLLKKNYPDVEVTGNRWDDNKKLMHINDDYDG